MWARWFDDAGAALDCLRQEPESFRHLLHGPGCAPRRRHCADRGAHGGPVLANAGLYATGRTLRSMALAGEAPAVAAKLNRHQVPAGGIAITAGLGIVGVIINAAVPASAFNIIMDVAAVGIAGTWISVLISHWIFVNRAKQGLVERPSYRLRFAPWSNLIGIIFFAIVILAMGMSATA